MEIFTLIRKYWWFCMPLLLLIALSYHVTFTYQPEMFLWPWLMNHGWLPYRDFTLVYTPLLQVVLMIFGMILGFSPQTLHFAGTLFMIITTLQLMSFIRQLTSSKGLTITLGLVHAYLYIAFEGNTIIAASLLSPVFLGIAYVQLAYLKAKSPYKLFVIGILYGIAILIKQTSLYVLPTLVVFLGFVYWREKKLNINHLTAIFLGLLLTIGPFILYLQYTGTLSNFYDLTVNFAIGHASFKGNNDIMPWLFPSPRHIPLLFSYLVIAFYLAWLKKDFKGWLLFSWIGFSSLFIIPRFAYAHLLPSIALYILLVADSWRLLKSKGLRAPLVLLLSILLAWPIFKKTMIENRTYLEPEVLNIASYLNNSFPNSSIEVINTTEQYYFLTNKLPALKPWVEQIGWFTYRYDGNLYHNFVSNPPDIIVFHPFEVGNFHPSYLKYIEEHYIKTAEFNLKRDGVVQILKRVN